MWGGGGYVAWPLCWLCTLLTSPAPLPSAGCLLTLFVRVGDNAAAIRDCSTVLAHDESNVKALMRRAQAQVAVGDLESLEQAVRDYESCKRLTTDRATLMQLERE